MLRLTRGLLSAVLLFAAAGSFAVIETYEFSSPELEQRYHALSQELRCPKCQNQNIADSNAGISEDLRKLLYQQLEAGQSDQEILDDMVGRYGDFVRYRPALEGPTLWLWLAPALLLMVGVGLLLWVLRRARGAAPAPISDEERQRIDAVLGRQSGGAP